MPRKKKQSSEAAVGNDTTIGRAVVLCEGAQVGSSVVLGKNVLIDTGVSVPNGTFIGGSNTPPGSCTVPSVS